MKLHYYYQLYQLGTGGCTQKAQPAQGANPKPWEPKKQRPSYNHFYVQPNPQDSRPFIRIKGKKRSIQIRNSIHLICTTDLWPYTLKVNTIVIKYSRMVI